jgi:hypothetical protein
MWTRRKSLRRRAVAIPFLVRAEEKIGGEENLRDQRQYANTDVILNAILLFILNVCSLGIRQAMGLALPGRSKVRSAYPSQARLSCADSARPWPSLLH